MGNASYRWWENYLVRYLMPSIAGVVIFGWLLSTAQPSMKNLFFFDLIKEPTLNTATLILLLLYGNLFCYIASYPILCFHATRVIDHVNHGWKPRVIDGYLASLVLGMVVLIGALHSPGRWTVYFAYMLVIAFSILQCMRIFLSLKKTKIKGLKEDASLAYGYAYSLAVRRGVLEKTTSKVSESTQSEDVEIEFSNEEITVNKSTNWQREVVDSYRHLREHGNSAYILYLEIVLAGLCYLVLSAEGFSSHQQLGMIGILLAIWAVPAAAIHMLGQILERRFSVFDRKINSAQEKS